MAPGPMGQCFPIPEDEDIKRQMVTTAENQRKIYRMYNFDYVTKVCALQPDAHSVLCKCTPVDHSPQAASWFKGYC